MAKVVSDIIGAIPKVGQIADDLIESGEERQEQLSHRHEMDMVNGTWLTRNIIPLSLVALLAYWLVLLPLLQAYGIEVAEVQVKAIEYMSMTAFSFYFGSKAFEKVAVINAKAQRRKERRERRNK